MYKSFVSFPLSELNATVLGSEALAVCVFSQGREEKKKELERAENAPASSHCLHGSRLS